MRLPLVLVFALAAGMVHAQTLREAVDAAWSRHPQARLLDGRVAELEARQQVAGALFAGPGALTLSNRDDRFNRDAGRQEYEAEIAMPLWLPGQRGAQQRLAEGEALELEAQRRALRFTLTGEVRDAWLGLSLARSESALSRERLDTASKLEEDVKRRLRVGDVSRFDANLAESERLGAAAAVAEAESSQLETEVAFRTLTGIEARTDLPVETPADAEQQENPAVVAARRASATSNARLRAAQASARDNPEVSLIARRERDDFNQPYANTIGVRVRLPFSSTPRTREKIAAAQAEMNQADAALRQAELKVDLEQERTRRELATAQRQRDYAEERKRLAADNLTLARKAYQLGESDLVTLLRAQAADYDAARAVEKARLTLIAAQGRLNQALGVLP